MEHTFAEIIFGLSSSALAFYDVIVETLSILIRISTHHAYYSLFYFREQ